MIGAKYVSYTKREEKEFWVKSIAVGHPLKWMCVTVQ
jgi:hypothetical protein